MAEDAGPLRLAPAGSGDDMPTAATTRIICASASPPERTRRRRRPRRSAPTLLAAGACTVAACLASSSVGCPTAAAAAWGVEVGPAGRRAASGKAWRRDRVVLRGGYIKAGGGGSAAAPSPEDVTGSYVAPVPSADGDAAGGAGGASAAAPAAPGAPACSAPTLLDVLRPRPDRDVDQIGPTQLAFVGDIVYELFVRCRYLWPSRRTADVQSTVVGVVRAEAQSSLLAEMVRSFPLTEKEQSILTRGRNAGTGSRGRKKGPRRLDGGGGKGAAVYQDSTAFEALIGYTYMVDAVRCLEMLDWARKYLDRIDADAGIPAAGGPSSTTAATAAAAPSPSSLLDLLHPRPDRDVDRIAPIQLAYLGDSVYELLVRNRYVWPHRRTSDLHAKVVSVSRAETQARLCRAVRDAEESSCALRLTERERSTLTRGRNAGGGSNGRRQNGPRSRRRVDGGVGGAAIYQDAAALEALLGYTYLNDADRCLEMLQWVCSELDVVDSESPVM